MTSKLEYLQRYMSSSSGGDAVAKEKTKKTKTKKKKSKRTKSAPLGTHVVDADDAWELSAPPQETIERKWELDAAEDELPLVVTVDGEDERVDAQDLPVYVDSDKYLDELQGKKTTQKSLDDEDLSPPRKKGVEGCHGSRESDDGVSSVRKPKNTDDVSIQNGWKDDCQPSTRQTGACSDESGEDTVLPKRLGREQQPQRGKERSEDASPPRRPARVKRNEDASPPRRPARVKRNEDASPPRRGREKTKSLQHSRDDDNENGAGSSSARGPDVKKTQDASSMESHHMTNGSKQEDQKRQHGPSSSPAALDRQRRVDSLGRDIPPRRSRKERRSPSACSNNDATSKRHNNKAASSRSRSCSRGRSRGHNRSRSRGRGSDRDRKRDRNRDRSADVSPVRRRRRSRSPMQRARHHRSSRSPSIRKARSPKRSKERDLHERNRRHRSSSVHRSRSRSGSAKRRSPQHESAAAKEKGLPDKQDGRMGSRTDIIAPPALDGDVKSVSREDTRHAKETKESKATRLDDKEVKRAGLFTAAEFDRQREVAAKLKDGLHGADASEMGANAETVYRDKRGRKLDMLNELVRQQEVLDGKRKRKEREEYEWGTGEVQKRERKSQQELIEQMKSAPFARHEDDEELERKRRGRVRAFDPMHSKLFQENALDADKTTNAAKSKRGKKKATQAKPKYAGPPAPPNRFGIVPGYRWDGVVRGTNWEEKIMMRQNAHAAVSEEAYKYAVADM